LYPTYFNDLTGISIWLATCIPVAGAVMVVVPSGVVRVFALAVVVLIGVVTVSVLIIVVVITPGVHVAACGRVVLERTEAVQADAVAFWPVKLAVVAGLACQPAGVSWALMGWDCHHTGFLCCSGVSVVVVVLEGAPSKRHQQGIGQGNTAMMDVVSHTHPYTHTCLLSAG
jgi:hypothetical protein